MLISHITDILDDALLCRESLNMHHSHLTGVTADSRLVHPGMVFVAISGLTVNGVNFVNQALSRGASAIIVDNQEATTFDASLAPIIKVSDPRRALAKLASAFAPKQPKNILGITGTSGKTSVAFFVRQLLESAGLEAAAIGTLGVISNITNRDKDSSTPSSLTTFDPVTLHVTLDRLANQSITHVAIEVSSHGLDQRRADGVRFTAGCFTNLSHDHLDYHHNFDSYFYAKMRLFSELLAAGDPGIVCIDSNWGQKAAEVMRAKKLEVLSVGQHGDFLQLLEVDQIDGAQVCTIRSTCGLHRIKVPMIGDFQIHNALAAVALAISSGVQPQIALESIENLRAAPGRLELVGHTPSDAMVFVDYAHKPDALEKVLRVLRAITSQRLLVVFGCGGDRDHAKRPIMGAIAEKLADIVIVTDDNPRSESPDLIRQAIMSTAPKAIEIADRHKAIGYGIGLLRSGDIMVIAGKGHEKGQIIADQKIEFDDMQVARGYL